MNGWGYGYQILIAFFPSLKSIFKKLKIKMFYYIQHSFEITKKLRYAKLFDYKSWCKMWVYIALLASTYACFLGKHGNFCSSKRLLWILGLTTTGIEKLWNEIKLVSWLIQDFSIYIRLVIKNIMESYRTSSSQINSGQHFFVNYDYGCFQYLYKY